MTNSHRHGLSSSRDLQLENFAAELTNVAYPVALRHGSGDSWIKMELGLWRALGDTVKKWAPGRPPADLRNEFESWREAFLEDLTVSALYVAAKHGIKGSLLQVEVSLYRIFRLVIRRRLTPVRDS